MIFFYRFSKYVCDHSTDCADGSDEANCSQTAMNLTYDANASIFKWQSPLLDGSKMLYDVYVGDTERNASKRM